MDARAMARQVLKPLFARPVSPEEVRVCDDVTALADRIAELEAALRPFALLADQVAREALTSPTDATVGLLSVVYADLRRATEALNNR